MNNVISFEVQKNFGTLSSATNGWTKQLSLISWNGREAKFDIRDWDDRFEKMGRGVTLTKEEAKALKELLNSIDI